MFEVLKNVVSLQSQNNGGTIAQLVEQWTENPCVASSNLAGTTKKPTEKSAFFLFPVLYLFAKSHEIITKIFVLFGEKKDVARTPFL